MPEPAAGVMRMSADNNDHWPGRSVSVIIRPSGQKI